MNIAIRWFIGYGLEDRLPDHSSLTRIRAALGGGAVPGDIPPHGSGVPGGEGGQGRSRARGRLIDPRGRELGESGGASRGRGDVGEPLWRRRPGRRVAEAAGAGVRGG